MVHGAAFSLKEAMQGQKTPTPEDSDFLRRSSEALGVAIATCWCVDVLHLKWSSISSIQPSRRRGRRADYIGTIPPGDLVFEAKGTSAPNSVRGKLASAQAQKSDSRSDEGVSLGLALVSWIPVDYEHFEPHLFVTDPPGGANEISGSERNQLRGLLIRKRVATYGGFDATARVLGTLARRLRRDRLTRISFNDELRSAVEEDRGLATTRSLARREYSGLELTGPMGTKVFLGLTLTTLTDLQSPVGTNRGSPATENAVITQDSIIGESYSDGTIIALDTKTSGDVDLGLFKRLEGD